MSEKADFMSENEGVGTKRTYSKVDTPSDSNADDERRNLIREEMAKPSGEDVLVETQWLNQFFDGEDAPILLAKGEAASSISADAFKRLKEWYGVRSDALAVRIFNLERNKPAEVVLLEPSKTLGEALDTPSSYWFYGANVYSAFPERNSLDYFGHPLDASVPLEELTLERQETIVIENPENRPLGRTGLGNMGNSCFMNSSLQCLLHIPELATYFLSNDFSEDLNRENPIGCRGEVADAFAELARQSYTESGSSFRPVQFRNAIGKFNRSFANRMQQDSQEFTAFLLDSLHEDLNRVQRKPATTEPELGDNERPTEEVVRRLAHQSWETHKKRNDSKIMDLFTGMYKSTLICPVCDKVSLRFDPFFDLTLPLPSSTYWVHSVAYVPSNSEKTPTKIDVALSPADSVIALKQQVAQLMGSLPERLIAGDVFQRKFYRILADSNTVADTIEASDVIVLYETALQEELVVDQEQNIMRQMTPASENQEEQSVDVPVYVLSPSYPGYPFFVSITQSTSADEIKRLVSAKLEQQVGSCQEFKIKVFEGNIDDLAYTVDERRTWLLDEPSWRESDTAHHLAQDGPRTPPSDTEEPFENVMVPRPSEESSEQVRSPAASPGSSSISPLSDTGSPPAISGYNNATEEEHNERHLNPHNAVLLVEIEDDSQLEEAAPAFRVVENPSATHAKNVLEAHRTTTLEDCLDRFSQPEVLSENDLWYCPRCKEFRQAQKQIELWRVPDVLMIHLKRFSGSMSFSKKIDDLVTFPLENLDLSKHLSVGAQHDNEALIYDLIAVDNHYGGMGGGHYTAYVWDAFTKEWLNFNDSFVSVAEPSNVVSPAAYLLFYKRRAPDTTAIDSVREVIANLRAGKATVQEGLVDIAEQSVTEAQPMVTDTQKSDVFIGEGHRLGSSSAENESSQLPWS